MKALRAKKLTPWLVALTLLAPLFAVGSAQADEWDRYQRRLRKAEREYLRDVREADRDLNRAAWRKRYPYRPAPVYRSRSYVVPGPVVVDPYVGPARVVSPTTFYDPYLVPARGGFNLNLGPLGGVGVAW